MATRYPCARIRRKASSRARFTPASIDTPSEDANCFAGVQQFVETFTCSSASPSRGEFDVTGLLAALGSGSDQAHGESIENTAGIGQHNLASVLHKQGLDFTSKIQTFVDLIGKLPACLDGRFSLAFLARRHLHRRMAALRRLLGRRSQRHNGGKIARPIIELLVQAHVFDTLREREQAGVPYTPSVEDPHRGFEQSLGHSTIPVFREHSQGSEEPEGSPARDNVRSDQVATYARRKHLDVARSPAWGHKMAVTHEFNRIGNSEERSKRKPNNTIRRFEFALFQRTNFDQFIRRHSSSISCANSRSYEIQLFWDERDSQPNR